MSKVTVELSKADRALLREVRDAIRALAPKPDAALAEDAGWEPNNLQWVGAE